MRRLLLPLTIIAVLLTANTAHAAYIDLTTANAEGTINGALFIQGTVGAGTGVFPAFVEITGNDPVHDAYNTTENNTLDNGATDQFNHEILFTELRGRTIDSIDYYSFILDINESNNSIDTFLSLDALKVITSAVPNQDAEPLPLGTLVYDMGAGNGVLMKYDIENGGGWSDMELLVPVSYFTGTLSTDYVYLYSSFGSLGVNPAGAPAGNYGASDGPEQWALGTGVPFVPPPPPPPPDPAVPEPGSLLLLGSGLVGAAAAVRRRRQAKKQ